MSWFGKQVAPGKRPLKVNVFAHMTAHQGMLRAGAAVPVPRAGRHRADGGAVAHAARHAARALLSLQRHPRGHPVHGERGRADRDRPALPPARHARRHDVHPPAGGRRGQALPDLADHHPHEGDRRRRTRASSCAARSCNEIVFRMDRDIWQAPPHEHYPELANIRFYADAVDAFNAEPRACADVRRRAAAVPRPSSWAGGATSSTSSSRTARAATSRRPEAER